MVRAKKDEKNFSRVVSPLSQSLAVCFFVSSFSFPVFVVAYSLVFPSFSRPLVGADFALPPNIELLSGKRKAANQKCCRKATIFLLWRWLKNFWMEKVACYCLQTHTHIHLTRSHKKNNLHVSWFIPCIFCYFQGLVGLPGRNGFPVYFYTQCCKRPEKPPWHATMNEINAIEQR